MLLAAGLLVAACNSPSAPSAEARRFAELMDAPALGVDAARDSAFAAALWTFRDWSGITDAGLTVVRDADTWVDTWDVITSHVAPKPDVPDVDFGSETVLLVAYGVAPTLGYSVEIAHITQVRDTIFVLAERTRPGSNCATLQALSMPLAGRLVPQSDLPSVLLTEQYVYDCEAGRRRPDR